MSDPAKRKPAWVYGEGDEPDPRFTLANERTFLAWIRTSLTMLAGGVALDTIDLGGPGPLQSGLAVALVVLGMLSAGTSWLRWARVERSMRRREPLPSPAITVWLALGLVVVSAGLLVALR